MRAAVYKKYGSPDVVSIQKVVNPKPSAGEVLIKVHASTVNRTDTGFRSAKYFLSRLFSGLLRPKIPVLGCEFAGEVVAAGQGVRYHKVGDRVFGYDDSGFGGHAEYKVIRDDGALASIPDGMDYLEAAALTEGSHYALNNIRAAKVKKSDVVLVYGATGAIGSAAVQLLKHFGTYVVAVVNTKNVDLIRSLGIDEVIDYQTQDFTKTTHRFDFVFDAVGKSSFAECKPLMKPKGIYTSTELGKRGINIWLALTTPFGNGKKVLFHIPTIDKDDVLFLRNLAHQGSFRPIIDRQYALDDTVDAHRYVESGHKTGNVIISIV
ncbi:NAD(P)-dependent alcohol dehydrogenase [Sphingobacterium sp. JB170]|uniref:NAD(P)-dependent alcohol dehydrogenase n=1 Tax=Sphingobacterium sp. JB170 TaxID=1434842 RepID=UPI00097F5679|nr:NAD(P)-dependent alcohol dehydrogenase [Sphingobacterium sp. JB170]SJN20992.1 Alcohol dehydrogenase, zinc containing [Sphingobacterium sp. JB170]